MNIAVIMGGHPSEYDVSLNSGQTAIAALQETHRIYECVISKDYASWSFAGEEHTAEEALILLKRKADVCLLMLHGPFGEDGQIQALLQAHGIPYTGSNMHASCLANDKVASNAILMHHGFEVPDFVAFDLNAIERDKTQIEELGYPLIVKPARGGSSVGVSIVEDWQSIEILEPVQGFTKMIAQKFIEGTEVTCGVIDLTEGPQALPLVEIVPPEGRLFDYEAKYVEGESQELLPARVDDAVKANVKAAAITAHEALGCSGITRSDFIVDENGISWLLEINTAPGMTANSLVPKEIDYAELNLKIILEDLCQQGIDRE